LEGNVHYHYIRIRRAPSNRRYQPAPCARTPSPSPRRSRQDRLEERTSPRGPRVPSIAPVPDRAPAGSRKLGPSRGLLDTPLRTQSGHW
jgi:hypothetical protein